MGSLGLLLEDATAVEGEYDFPLMVPYGVKRLAVQLKQVAQQAEALGYKRYGRAKGGGRTRSFRDAMMAARGVDRRERQEKLSLLIKDKLPSDVTMESLEQAFALLPDGFFHDDLYRDVMGISFSEEAAVNVAPVRLDTSFTKRLRDRFKVFATGGIALIDRAFTGHTPSVSDMTLTGGTVLDAHVQERAL